MFPQHSNCFTIFGKALFLSVSGLRYVQLATPGDDSFTSASDPARQSFLMPKMLCHGRDDVVITKAHNNRAPEITKQEIFAYVRYTGYKRWQKSGNTLQNLH